MQLLFTCALAAMACGCASVPYAYAHIDRIPRIGLGEAAPQVTAVRVDYTAAGDPRWERTAAEYTIRLIAIDPHTSIVPRQERLGVTRGVYLNQVTLAHDRRIDEDLEVRLYRRGFRTVQVPSGGSDTTVRWLPATSATDRERAIDAILSPSVAGRTKVDDLPEPPLPADPHDVFRFALRRASDTRQACEFAAREYDMLLAGPGLPEADRSRVVAKAQALHELVRAGGPAATQTH